MQAGFQVQVGPVQLKPLHAGERCGPWIHVKRRLEVFNAQRLQLPPCCAHRQAAGQQPLWLAAIAAITVNVQAQAAHVLPMPQQPGQQRAQPRGAISHAEADVAAQHGRVRALVPALADEGSDVPACGST